MNKNKKITFVSLDELIDKEEAALREEEDSDLCYGYPDEVELDFNDDKITTYDPEIHE